MTARTKPNVHEVQRNLVNTIKQMAADGEPAGWNAVQDFWEGFLDNVPIPERLTRSADLTHDTFRLAGYYECRYCKAKSDQSTLINESVYRGGHGWDMVKRCKDVQACEDRRA